MSFSFDFAAASTSSVEGTKDSVQTKNDANELIAKLIDRSKNNSNACTFVNACSKVLPNDDVHKTTIHAKEEFQPHLRFHDHESIDLMSKMDNLRYVMPKHTISDDTTDLIPGVYEGGLKVWECSIDLCRFLAHIIDNEDLDSEHCNDSNAVVNNALVRCLGPSGSTMEIGCGHGLPGCLILRESIRRGFNCDKNKSVVIFSDFNDFVLHHATIPNAQVNVCGLRGDDGVAMDECQTAKALVERSMFVGGDWMGLSHKLSNGNLPLQVSEDGRLDLILAAETTYTPESCQDTAFLMLSHLKIDVGVGLVATKRFYFGVGGGTDLFTTACKKLASDQGPFAGLQLCIRTIQSYDTGNANIRDLLEVTCKKKSSG